MWSEPDLPEESSRAGSTINMNNFRKLLSVWPGAPHRLKFPAESDSRGNTTEWDLFLPAAQFYMQTAFDHFGRQPLIPHLYPSS